MKKGFTLAEVLITLAIIGVVSAITLPTLTSNTKNAQVGPKLAKAVSMFEQAHQNMLLEKNLDSITGLATGTKWNLVNDSETTYLDPLQDYMKFLSYGTEKPYDDFDDVAYPAATCGQIPAYYNDLPYFITKDGVMYIVSFDFTAGNLPTTSNKPHRYGVGYVVIDINGRSLPNTAGKDIFFFVMYADGSLRPYGSTNSFDNMSEKGCKWEDVCPTTGDVTNYAGCAGHIFANDLKILYK